MCKKLRQCRLTFYAMSGVASRFSYEANVKIADTLVGTRSRYRGRRVRYPLRTPLVLEKGAPVGAPFRWTASAAQVMRLENWTVVARAR